MMTALAALAVCALFAADSARAADVTHYAGGPTQVGNRCWVSTDSVNGFGYWQDCPKPGQPSKKTK